MTTLRSFWRRLRGDDCRRQTAVVLDRLDTILDALDAAQAGHGPEAERVLARLRTLAPPAAPKGGP